MFYFLVNPHRVDCKTKRKKVSVIKRLANEAESDNINKLLGLDYSADDLQEIYNECEANINEIAQAGVEEGLELLKSINIKLAEHYKELLVLACEIIANSDCFVANEENAVINSISAMEV